MRTQVHILKTCDPACVSFVERDPKSKLSHMPAWSFMIERTFGHKSFYLLALNGNEVKGVLPLVEIRSKIFGNRMVSQAFSNYGGPLAKGPEILNALFNCAVETAKERGCEYIEFRDVDVLPYNLQQREDKISMYLTLTPDPEQLWRSFRPKVRNQVRKAEKSRLYVVRGKEELLNDFYKVWTIRMRELGTPCYPRKLFGNILTTFPEKAQIFLVRFQNLTVGAAFVYGFNAFVQIRWAATLIDYNKLCPNNLLYWSVMKHYCLAGASVFDFGRTTAGSGHHRFKQQWGPETVQLRYQYWLAHSGPLSLVSPDSSKYKKKVYIWKRLPLWTTRLVGPCLSRSLP